MHSVAPSEDIFPAGHARHSYWPADGVYVPEAHVSQIAQAPKQPLLLGHSARESLPE